MKLISAALAGGFAVPAFADRRKPYVNVREVVDHIGPAGTGFCGGRIVKKVGEWDGVGYPVFCDSGFLGIHKEDLKFYDFDLVCFQRELPKDFWWTHSPEEWPNVHTWVRTQRFGESVVEAMRKLNFAGVRVPKKRLA